MEDEDEGASSGLWWAQSRMGSRWSASSPEGAESQSGSIQNPEESRVEWSYR